jgi:hypothetical protein
MKAYVVVIALVALSGWYWLANVDPEGNTAKANITNEAGTVVSDPRKGEEAVDKLQTNNDGLVGNNSKALRAAPNFKGRLRFSGLGGELNQVHGKVALMRLSDSNEREVTFSSSTLEVSLPLGEYEVASVSLNGEARDFSIEANQTLIANGPELQVYIVDTARKSLGALNVVDRSGGEHLDNVTVLVESPHGDKAHLGIGLGIGLESGRHNADPQSIATPHTNGTSPLSVEAVPANALLWVGSPGYAWSCTAAPGEGESKTVVLDKSSDLVIETTNAEASEQLLSVTISARTKLLTEKIRGYETSRYNMLPAGLVDVRVEVASKTGRGQILYSEALQLIAGETRHIQINASCWAASEELSGCYVEVMRDDAAEESVQWTIEWGAPGEVDTSLTMLKDWSLVSEDGDTRRVHQKTYSGLTPGVYTVKVHPVGVEKAVELLPGKTESMYFDLRNLVSVELVPSGRGGVDVGSSFIPIEWGYVGEFDGCDKGFGTSLHGFSGGEPLVLQVLPRTIQICSGAWDWECVDVFIDPKKGRENKFVVPISKRVADRGVQITVKRNGETIKDEMAVYGMLRFKPKGHDGKMTDMRFVHSGDESHVLLKFDVEGSYEVSVEGSKVKKEFVFGEGITDVLIELEE